MTATGSRPCCARCLRPSATCLCGLVEPTANQAHVLILQHPLELRQSKGSARLLALSLERSTLITGEAFEPTALAARLAQGGLHNVLLYPRDDNDNDNDNDNNDDVDMTAAPALPADAGRLRLVVLDGTWRKSRKMLHLNPALRALPRLALTAPPPSAYVIRKAHRTHQLSTLEATCLALQQLESAPDRYRRLMAAFTSFVARQAARTSASDHRHPSSSRL